MMTAGGDEGRGGRGDEGGPNGTMMKFPASLTHTARSLLVCCRRWLVCVQRFFESFVQFFFPRWTWCPLLFHFLNFVERVGIIECAYGRVLFVLLK